MTGGQRTRRGFLKGTAATALTVGISYPGTVTTQSRFETVINAIAAGADPDGSKRVDSVLEGYTDDDTLIEFPEGTYRLGSLNVGPVRNFGLRAKPEARVLFEPATPASEQQSLMAFEGVEDLLLEGLAFDFSRTGFGNTLRVIANGDFLVQDIGLRGQLPDQDRTTPHVGFRFDVRDPDATGVVRDVTAPDGGHQGGNGVGILVGKDHAGTLRFENCTVANFPNNGLYASAPGRSSQSYTGRDGVVHVKGGLYANNNIANVRLGSTGSTAHGVTVRVDSVPPHPSLEKLNVRGIRLRAQSGQFVSDCDITITSDAGPGFGAIVYHPDHGSSTVRNTTIHVDKDEYNAVRAVNGDSGGTEAPITLQNVSITGDAAGGTAVVIADRDRTVLRDCVIRQSGTRRDGIRFTNADRCLVTDSTIQVPGEPLSLVNSSVRKDRLTV
ncbi:twin-arginine translocation signal domain-containing protein [Haloarcula sp. H-GB5]